MPPLRLEYLDPATLADNGRNWRTHPKAQLDALGDVIAEVGWAGALLYNEQLGRLVDGHARKKIPTKGQPVPVLIGSWTEAEEAKILATLDPIAAMAESDSAALDALLRDVDTGSEALQTMLGNLAKSAGLYAGPADGLTDPDDVPDVPDEPITQPGDLWLLGEHRLLCGDSTTVADVEQLLDGAKPALMVTDPPYGVEYDPNWRNEAADKGLFAHAVRRVGEVANDERVDWTDAWSLSPADVAYCWHADRHASTVQSSLESAKFEIRCQIVWAKSRFAISRGHYNWQHEPCWYAVRKGATAHWAGSHSESTVWEINLDKNVDGGHSTQKPVECMQRPIRNHEGDVYDPFLGSGTTLIAAEQLGRRCYGLEIEPKYCDVIVRRWEAFTGKTAERVTA